MNILEGHYTIFCRIGVLVVIFTLILMLPILLEGPGVPWKPFSQISLAEAKSSGKPVIIDFYADWCTPCRDLEKKTFHDQNIVRESEKFIMIKVDVTRRGDQGAIQLLEKYNVKGVPTVIFLDPMGNELKELRVMDFIRPEAFLLNMHNALEKTRELERSPDKKL